MSAGFCLLATVWPQQQLDSGPDPVPFYERLGTESRLVASEQMLSHLVAAFDANAPKVARRSGFFKAGFVLLSLGLAGVLVVILLS